MLYVKDAKDHQFLLAGKKKDGNLVGVIVSDCVFIIIVSSVPVVFGYQPILRMFCQVNIQIIF